MCGPPKAVCGLRKSDMDGLLHHLKNIHPTINFITEGGSLPFLDNKVTREDDKLDIATITHRALSIRPHHPAHVKRNTVGTTGKPLRITSVGTAET